MSWPFSVEVAVRFRDCDPMRHVNNAALATYLEIARTDYYMARRGIAEVSEVDFILARLEIDFKSQATFGEVMVVSVRPGQVGASSFTLEYEVREKVSDRLVASAKTVQVCYDYAAGKKRAIPSALRKALGADGGKPRKTR